MDKVYNIICVFIQHKRLLMALDQQRLLTDYPTLGYFVLVGLP